MTTILGLMSFWTFCTNLLLEMVIAVIIPISIFMKKFVLIFTTHLIKVFFSIFLVLLVMAKNMFPVNFFWNELVTLKGFCPTKKRRQAKSRWTLKGLLCTWNHFLQRWVGRSEVIEQKVKNETLSLQTKLNGIILSSMHDLPLQWEDS